MEIVLKMEILCTQFQNFIKKSDVKICDTDHSRNENVANYNPKLYKYPRAQTSGTQLFKHENIMSENTKAF